MYVSMTGFARTVLQKDWGTLSLELSSVNHRYQEIYVRLPRELSSWEPWFHQKMRKHFRRGKVQLRVDVLFTQAFKMGRINASVLSSYCEEFLKIQRSIGQAKELSIESIATFPGVLDIPKFEDYEDSDTIESTFTALIEEAAKSWQNMRLAEGSHLRDDVLSNLSELERLVSLIEKDWALAKEDAFRSFKERLQNALESIGGKLEDARFLQEIVILTDKWDISEEIARLKSHILKFRQTGDEKDSAGRKLDFIVQEMNREVNTLDSKVADVNVRWLAVDAKSALERIREQIQNLE